MPKYGYNQLTFKQYVFFIYKTQVGIGVLSLPRDLAEISGTDGWISIFLGWLFCIFISILIIKIMEKHPEQTLFDILPQYFGKWLGNGIIILWILYATFSASVVLLTSIHIVQVWILPRTSYQVLLLLFLVPIYISTRHGIRVIGRLAEFVYVFTLWLPLIMLLALRDIHWLHFLPIAKEGWVPILGAVKKTTLSFLGFEMAFFLYPFLQEKKAAYKGIILANTMSMVIFLLVAVISYLRFSSIEVKQFIWPTLNVLKLIRLPFLERLEIIFLSFYLFVLFMTVIPYLYVATWGTAKMLGKQDHRPFLGIFVLLWIVLSCFFVPTYKDVIDIGKVYGQTGLTMTFAFPFFLFLYSRLMLWRRGLYR